MRMDAIRRFGAGLVFGVSLTLLLAACSLGGSSASGGGGDGAELVDPCAPECCCRAKDNYYIRYSCKSPDECAALGGECATDKVGKCESESDGSSAAPSSHPEPPLALISAPRLPSLFV